MTYWLFSYQYSLSQKSPGVDYISEQHFKRSSKYDVRCRLRISWKIITEWRGEQTIGFCATVSIATRSLQSFHGIQRISRKNREEERKQHRASCWSSISVCVKNLFFEKLKKLLREKKNGCPKKWHSPYVRDSVLYGYSTGTGGTMYYGNVLYRVDTLTPVKSQKSILLG